MHATRNITLKQGSQKHVRVCKDKGMHVNMVTIPRVPHVIKLSQ